MKIAVEGCAHGELERIYESIEYIEKLENIKVDLLICCGDFQSTRNLEDLQTMAVPKKYQDMCTFYKYYSGEKLAPILTIFIGGNHEASNYLQELPYGGWVAPNIYYMGYAGVVNFNGIRIGGVSGIYKDHDYFRGHHEFSPYSETTKRSVYHVRQLEVFRLKQLTGNIDIFLSHDWPRGVHNFGNHQQLVRFKPHFRDEIQENKLGSPANETLLNCLKPNYWFAAHLHCKFAALVQYDDSEKSTKFLALDKCLPKRKFLQILDIESELPNDGEKRFEYDLEWLTILYLTNHLLSVRNSAGYMPGPNGDERYDFNPTDDELENVRKKFSYDLQIPENFCKTVEPYNPDNIKIDPQQPKSQINPQTLQFCDQIGIDDPLSLSMILNGHELSHSSTFESSTAESSIFIDSEEQISFNSSSGTGTSPLKRLALSTSLPKPKLDSSANPDEVDIEEENDENLHKDTKLKITEDQTPEPIDESTAATIAETFEETTPPIKKFKRRNLCIYGSNNDD